MLINLTVQKEVRVWVGKHAFFYPHVDLTNLKLCLAENRGGDKQPPEI